MNDFEIKKASRVGIKPLIGFYSESGCGKTMSSLLLARGFVGPTGKIVMLDTESGRGSLYADVIPGGYDVLELRDDFSPARYIDAVATVEKSGADILVVDSGSHEWEGISGVTDMAMNISRAAAEKWNKDWDGVVQFGHWKQPKMEHSKFMLKMLQSPLPIIVCLRSKHKSRQLKGTQEMADRGEIEKYQIGKSLVIKDKFTTPIQADDFIFEMTAHGEILQDHSLRLTKCSHPSLGKCFPAGKPVDISHGEALAAWCRSAGGSPVVSSKKPLSDLDKLKQELFALSKAPKGDMKAFEIFCWSLGHSPERDIKTLTGPELESLIVKAKEKAGQLI